MEKWEALYDTTPADPHLWILLFGMLFLFAIHDFLKYLENRKRNKNEIHCLRKKINRK